MKNFKTHSGYILALLATLIWSGNFIVARDLNASYSPVSISFFRWLIATVVILPFALPHLKRDFKLLIAQWRLILVLSLTGVTVFNTLIYLAAHTTSAFNLSLFAITAPIYVVFFNWMFYKEIITRNQTIGFIILLVGLLVLLSKGNPEKILELEFNRGDLWMAVAASIFAFYSSLLRKKNPALGNLSFLSSTFILGVFMLIPFFIIDLMSSSLPLKFTTSSTLQFIFIGVGPSIISYYLWNKSVVEIGSTKAATIYNTLPIFSAFFAALFLNEQVLAIQIVSSAIIVAGVLLVLLGKRNKISEYESGQK
ncbi:MAG: DMT family transporter [Bacteroidetes bacterium]|nr:DMT family transporter [Bacteroidota bacterium]MBP7398657.1 DMT family transporter [Chitinophagales bacterium]MBK8487664.1 DMT family transporter [Bacteroidota bacterium]MBP8753641.1 DMT family transporter [Chitinophagales bacterium]MBP9188040.1 DMT family transporter [Chitinophagales bacterium]